VGSGVGMGPELCVPRGRSGHGARGWWLPREGDGRGCRFRAGMQGGPKPDDDDNISLFLVVGLLKT
jgi:hypothetical protein